MVNKKYEFLCVTYVFSVLFFIILLSGSIVLLSDSIVYAQDQIKEIRIADAKGDWGYPNPYRHYPRGPGYIRMSWVFDTLVWKDKDNYIPALANSWKFDKKSMSYVFELNKQARWHDGQPVTGEDVVFTIDYMKKHPYRWIDLSRIAGAKLLKKHTVAVLLKKGYAPFLSDIGGTMPILPRHIWKDIKNPKAFDEPLAYIGSGPYRFKDYDRANKTYLYESFDTYYLGKPKVHKLIYIKTGNPIMALSTRQASLSAIQPDMATFLKQKGFTILANQYGWNKKLMINHTTAPFNNVKFRQALAFMINRQEIIDKAHRGFGKIASCGLLSMDHDMYNPDTAKYPFNPSKGHDLIKSLGYKKNDHGYYEKDGAILTIELLSSNITVAGGTANDRDGEIIKKQLDDEGIKTQLIHMEQTTVDSKIKNWDFMLAVSGHGGIMGDPKVLNEMIGSKYGAGSVNSARFDTDTRLNSLMEQQMETMDPEKRKAVVFQIQELHAQLLPAIPLYCPDTYSAFDPSAKIDWFYTKGGISKGIPISQNKMSLVR
ncbi:ABC transporter substrate-binding protein [Desulfobacula phenolica]|uniref:Peptide/nickel transport system substrate-binding protein n=1 Tax=Desulfobacula phenolica TaxID=90732 RepID=A0A1H2IT32_9BACT|nr:ABC transporter substrate-binding protein [Desulfobacula phenolica]SDU47299.1 peptide/nickel transport system substrate-binding protein [Desulfobacula phenolica]